LQQFSIRVEFVPSNERSEAEQDPASTECRKYASTNVHRCAKPHVGRNLTFSKSSIGSCLKFSKPELHNARSQSPIFQIGTDKVTLFKSAQILLFLLAAKFN
jgi:hypothetical protein